MFRIVTTLVMLSAVVASAQPIDLGKVTEKHEMIPMRDGKKLSAYLYFPPGKGPWPVVFEQRYADIRGAGTAQGRRPLAANGYVVAMVNFRGTHESEGTWVGYRALGWGELQDGYDTCEWLAKQPWSTGQGRHLRRLAGGLRAELPRRRAPPHLICQYMVDTGLSLFHEGYRIGGTHPAASVSSRWTQVCRNPADNRQLLEEWFRTPPTTTTGPTRTARCTSTR